MNDSGTDAQRRWSFDIERDISARLTCLERERSLSGEDLKELETNIRDEVQ